MDKQLPRRSAWVEIDNSILKNNFKYFGQDRPELLNFLSVVKDDAYGHGATSVAKVATSHGARYFGVTNITEAEELRKAGIKRPILMFGALRQEERELCWELNLTPTIHSSADIIEFQKVAIRRQKQIKVHVEVETGMGRYGIRWDKAADLFKNFEAFDEIAIEGIYTHFAMSDEQDKSFAMEQLSRFKSVLNYLEEQEFEIPLKHSCNSGGFLDIPPAHFDMVRVGILPLGVFPSKVCRRISGIKPVMSVRAQLAIVREIKKGDNVGYGLRFTAPQNMRIGVIPLGYGDGYPRVRNSGHVLIHGKEAYIIGGNAMDTTIVSLDNIPEAEQWDEITLMGHQGNKSISAHDIAKLKGTVSYEVLTGWRARLPRLFVN